MQPILKRSVRPRRIIKWFFIAVVASFAPIIVLAIVAVNYLTLDRDARLLMAQMVDATDGECHTTIQFNLGQATVHAARFALGFVQDKKIRDLRKLLDSINQASVGVYQFVSTEENRSHKQLLTTTDQAMSTRGWSRIVGVVDKDDTVIIYGPNKASPGTKFKACIAVRSQGHLVVVLTQFDAVALVEIAENLANDRLLRHSHLPDDSF